MFDLAISAFNSLTHKQRNVWQLHMRDGKSEYETAKMLKISRDAVHDRLNKARKRYKKFIKDHK